MLSKTESEMQELLASMEPQAIAIDRSIPLASIAVSMKRIADNLQLLTELVEEQKDLHVEVLT